MSTHADAVREAERAVVEASLVVRAARKVLHEERGRERLSGGVSRVADAAEKAHGAAYEAWSAAVDALLALRAATCPTCGGGGRKVAMTVAEERDESAEWSDADAVATIPCPSLCDHGRKVGA